MYMDEVYIQCTLEEFLQTGLWQVSLVMGEAHGQLSVSIRPKQVLPTSPHSWTYISLSVRSISSLPNSQIGPPWPVISSSLLHFRWMPPPPPPMVAPKVNPSLSKAELPWTSLKLLSLFLTDRLSFFDLKWRVPLHYCLNSARPSLNPHPLSEAWPSNLPYLYLP